MKIFSCLLRDKFFSLASVATGVPAIIPGYWLVGFRDVSWKSSQKLHSIKLVSSTVFGGVGDDVILDRKLFKRDGSPLDIPGNKLLWTFILYREDPGYTSSPPSYLRTELPPWERKALPSALWDQKIGKTNFELISAMGRSGFSMVFGAFLEDLWDIQLALVSIWIWRARTQRSATLKAEYYRFCVFEIHRSCNGLLHHYVGIIKYRF